MINLFSKSNIIIHFVRTKNIDHIDNLKYLVKEKKQMRGSHI